MIQSRDKLVYDLWVQMVAHYSMGTISVDEPTDKTIHTLRRNAEEWADEMIKVQDEQKRTD